MLLMVGAESTIVRAIPSDGRVVSSGHFRRLDENFAAPLVIVHVVGQKDLFGSVNGALLQQEDSPIFEDDFSFQLAETRRADRQGDVIKEVRPHLLSHRITSIPSINAQCSNHSPYNSAEHHHDPRHETNRENKSN